MRCSWCTALNSPPTLLGLLDTKLALWHMNAVQWQISCMEFMKPSIEFSARLVGVQTNENKVSSLVLHGEKPVNKYGMYTSLNTSELMLL